MGEMIRANKGLLGTVAIVVGWMLTLATLVWTASAQQATTRMLVAANTERIGDSNQRIEDHEQRVRSLESQAAEIAAMRNDVAWIKRALGGSEK